MLICKKDLTNNFVKSFFSTLILQLISYYVYGDVMKKIILWSLIAILSGLFLGYKTFKKYNNIDIKNVSMLDNGVYMIKYGSYNSYDDMINKTNNIDRFIYINDNNKYTSYIGVTKNKKNAEKVKKIYIDKKDNLKVEKIYIENEEFIRNLDEYEKLIDKTNDEEAIKTLQNQILSCYEKLVAESE